MPKSQKIFHPYIDNYITGIRSGTIVAGRDIPLAIDLVEQKLSDPDVFVDAEKIDKANELITKYFYPLFDWELFVLALTHCFYKSIDRVVFNEFLIMMGTGNGKNGFISPLIWYFSTHYHGIKNYNIDLIANSEEQCLMSFNDVYNVLEDTWDKSKHFFYKTKEIIINTRTNSYIKYNTANAKTRLGKRAACLIFDEILEYEDWVVYNAYNASFGKKKHNRKYMITTNGYVRQGFLDDQLELARGVLTGEITNLGFLPLLYRLDKKEEVHDRAMWPKANPSYHYLPELKNELETAYTKMVYQPQLAIDFMTKRMNLPAEDAFTVVAPWEKILATNQEIPYDDLKGRECIGALDYARTTDFCSCGLLFKLGGKRYWLEHTFVCYKALEVESRPIKFPVQEMADRGLITIIRRDNISAEDVSAWFLQQAKTYRVKNIACDSYRASLLESEFKQHGLPLTQVRSGPITHAKIAPLIEQVFAEETLSFGDNPTMRWYVNNTYQEIDKKGNTGYYKIEAKTRKTDGFFALLHALSLDGELQDKAFVYRDLDAYTY